MTTTPSKHYSPHRARQEKLAVHRLRTPGKRAAAIQTLPGTANLHGLTPTEWLADTLEKLPAWPNSRIDELLPFAPEDIEALLKKCG
ncbi:MAG: transposase domain-containing protein [Nitrosomonas sp.]|nr:transposase domain-containing protein [Nitrosomonas sp.]